MRGFTDRGLLLFSSMDDYLSATWAFTGNYRLALTNLLAYLKSVGIGHDCFITDELAFNMSPPDTRWLATGASEDVFFMTKFCNVPSYPLVPLDEKLCQRIRKDFPLKRGMSQEDRASIIQKRVELVENKLIASYQLVIVFGNTYKVKTKEDDGRAVIHIDKAFVPTLELSGQTIPINDFLQLPYGNLTLLDWGKYHE